MNGNSKMLNYHYVVFSVLIYLGFNFWMKCIGEFLGIKKPAGAGLLKGYYHGIFNILASTTTPTILQFPLISIIGYCGFKGFRKRLPASITNFLKVASFQLGHNQFPINRLYFRINQDSCTFRNAKADRRSHRIAVDI